MKQWGEEKGKNNFEYFFIFNFETFMARLNFFSNNLQLLSLKSKAAVFKNGRGNSSTYLGSKLTYVGTRDVS
jgi:hypothetical protein